MIGPGEVDTADLKLPLGPSIARSLRALRRCDAPGEAR
jgi:hypothetical protein